MTHVTVALTCAYASIKSLVKGADTECMMILNLHGQHATNIVLRAGVPIVHQAISDVSVDVVQAAILVAENTPDPRTECVELALVHMDAGKPDSHSVAQAMITSIIADSHR